MVSPFGHGFAVTLPPGCNVVCVRKRYSSGANPMRIRVRLRQTANCLACQFGRRNSL